MRVKLYLDLGAALAVYLLVAFLSLKTALKVEWFWRSIHFLAPLVYISLRGKPLRALGLTLRRASKSLELGLVTGVILTVGLAPLFMAWFPPRIQVQIDPSVLGYAVVLVLTNVGAMELFYRGYLQPLLQTAVGRAPGLILASLLCGADFWEAKVFNPGVVVTVAVVLGFIYWRTKSLLTPIAAHSAFFLLTLAWLSF